MNFEQEVQIRTGGLDNPLHLLCETGPIADPDTGALAVVQVDESASTGGSISLIHLLSTRAGQSLIYALDVGNGIAPIKQHQNAFIDPGATGSILKDAITGGTDVSASVRSDGAGGVTMFSADDDVVYFFRPGPFPSRFGSLQFVLATPASPSGVEWEWEYYDSVAAAWVPFVPVDGTHGLQNSGVVSWNRLLLTNWGIHPTNSLYGVRVTRRRDSLGTAPVVDLVQFGGQDAYTWDEDGAVYVRSLQLDVALPTDSGGTGVDNYLVGDTLYCSATDTLSKLAGNKTTTRKFLRQVGDGSASAAPEWDTVASTDISDSTTTGRALVTATDAADGRTALSLGSIATQASNSVSITGGAISGITDLAVADGGTGASTAPAARDNLGILTAYVSSQLDVSSNTSLQTPTLNRNVTLRNGKKYAIRGYFPFTCASAGGVRGRLSGAGLTGTILFHQTIKTDAGVQVAGGKFTSFASSTASGTGAHTSGVFEVSGSILATADANLTFLFAQDTSNGTASSLLVGGWLTAIEVE